MSLKAARLASSFSNAPTIARFNFIGALSRTIGPNDSTSTSSTISYAGLNGGGSASSIRDFTRRSLGNRGGRASSREALMTVKRCRNAFMRSTSSTVASMRSISPWIRSNFFVSSSTVLDGTFVAGVFFLTSNRTILSRTLSRPFFKSFCRATKRRTARRLFWVPPRTFFSSRINAISSSFFLAKIEISIGPSERIVNLPFGNSLTFVLTTRLSRSSSAYAAEASPRRLCVQLLSSYVMTRVVGPGRDPISRSTLRTCRERLPTAGAPQKYTHGIHVGMPKTSGWEYSYKCKTLMSEISATGPATAVKLAMNRPCEVPSKRYHVSTPHTQRMRSMP